MFLSDEELYKLTKRKQGKRQREKLAEMHVPFLTAADGRPNVMISWLHDMGIKSGAKMTRQAQPNYGALKNGKT